MLAHEPFRNPTLETAFRGQVQESFGGTNYRGLGARGVSWRVLALGQTLPAQRGALPETVLSRGLARALVVPRAPLATRSLLDPARDGWSEAQRWLTDRIPEPVFIRLLELLQYPLAVYRAACQVWEGVTPYVAGLRTVVRAAGERFLANAETMRERLRQGGLFPQEWAAISVLSLGTLRAPEWPAWIVRMRAAWALMLRRLGLHRAPPPDDAPLLRIRHLLFGLDVSLNWRQRALCSTVMQADADLVLCSRLDGLPAGTEASALLQQHAERVLSEGRRRVGWLRFASQVISLIVTYVVLGPAGVIMIALRLLLEGLLDVARDGQLTLPRA